MFSIKNELKLVIFSFLILLLLPVIAVIILTNAGIDIVSDKLATVNTKTQKIEIHDPLTGNIIELLSPVMEWPVKGIVTLEFGESDLPYQPLHTGIDIANPEGKIGDPIVPFMPGTVIYAGEIFWGFGKYIMINNGDNITSIYAHLSAIYVYQGEKVTLGQIMGEEGTTGWSTGPHLHFQININGIPVNPRTFLGDRDPN
jgi:murein DD-endopeptidase MepM/ murein hydrolase activator NlpD